ncbi:MFS transporter [Roseomonas populi]|uniref:MFS transporter n=1 Tax=Roseomonas populi TaxID=3121582 RepID=A0ABT1XAB5_9PROT|nr:MFS transporter [Roseomonas pecuniae]MCR0985043.1 MFS transporter [Roseomonas pecuniae]
MIAAGSLSGTPAPAAMVPSGRPLVGILAVLLGALISTLYGRITSFGLADLRGAVGAGFDEGAWIPTAATVAQMFIGPPATWLGAVYGPRRVLLASVSVFGLASVLIPFSPDLPALLLGQVVAGLVSGTFIPLTIGFVLQNLRPSWWPYGIAAFGLNLELSLNIPASLEGFYLDHLGWPWIFWQGAVLAVPMAACVLLGMPRQPVNRALRDRADGWGMLHAGAAFSLIYAALEQGNRLDWLHSGLICALLLGGALLLVAFVARELGTAEPWVNLSFLLRRNILPLLAILVLYRFVLLATAYLIPQYLTTVQNFRSLEVGSVLIWIAAPQFVLAPLVALVLTRVEPRIVLAMGAATMGVACIMAMRITPEWQTGEFLPSQIFQAVGQTSTLVAMILFFVRHLRPADALTFGAVLQTARLLGGELGSATMQTYLRLSEQVDSYLLGLHLQSGAADIAERLTRIAALAGSPASGEGDASGRALSILAGAVQAQANVLSVIDGFGAALIAVVAMLGLIALLREP